MSDLYMLSVLVVVVVEAGDSDVPWVAGVEEAGTQGNMMFVVVSEGEILYSYFLADSWTRKMNQEMGVNVAVVVASGVSQQLQATTSVPQVAVGGPLPQQVCRVPSNDQR